MEKLLNSNGQLAEFNIAMEIPQWISMAMSAIFALLWIFTMLPHTLIVQNLCLVIGAALGIYVIALNWRLLLTSQAIPIWLICLLFVWMGIHLLFIGKNFGLQLAEFQSLWKRAALGSFFAIGFGISVIQAKKNKAWQIVVLGLMAPTFIYYVKYLSTFALPIFGLNSPDFLKLYFVSAEFYVPKISYVFYCLPALALALGMLLMQLRKAPYPGSIKDSLFWVTMAVLILGVFYLENIKNGIVYACALIILFLIGLFKGGIYRASKLSLSAAIFISLITCSLAFNNLKTNPSWVNLLADLEVVGAISPEEVWRTAEPNYPLNKKGIQVASTNFDRAFYLRAGMGLLMKNPLGYGLVQSSFGHLAKERWPNAPIIQSHSGWLDLMLGLGFPGALLLLISALLAMQKAFVAPAPWNVFGVWVLMSILVLYLTTEVAQKNYVDSFVWLVVLVASLGLQKNPKIIEAQ